MGGIHREKSKGRRSEGLQTQLVDLVDVHATHECEDWLEDGFEDSQETRDELEGATENLSDEVAIQTRRVSN